MYGCGTYRLGYYYQELGYGSAKQYERCMGDGSLYLHVFSVFGMKLLATHRVPTLF